MNVKKFTNPFRPGAGHMPPYLAGRQKEEAEFKLLVKQEPILQNVILTGLRGVGKTVLLESLKPIALAEGWICVGSDLSESISVSEENLAIRIITDLSLHTSSIYVSMPKKRAGYTADRTERVMLNFAWLKNFYDETPGLVADKLKAVLEYVGGVVVHLKKRGVVFAYDEAQNLADNAERDQYPLSLLLDVFASIQRKGVPFLLLLTGLPTLFPKLVETRTYTERMFHVISLDRLSDIDTRQAIEKPIQDANCPVSFDEKSVNLLCKITGGYPFFIQFMCKEVYDTWIQQLEAGTTPTVPVDELLRKLDTDFFAGRWARVTERQRDLLWSITELPNHEGEFTVQEIAASSGKILKQAFGGSQVNQMLVTLGKQGLVYKNRHGKYSFAVPMFGQFIKRNIREANKPSA